MEKRKECEVLFPWVMADVHARSEVWDLVDLQKIGASHSPVRHDHARLALYRRPHADGGLVHSRERIHLELAKLGVFCAVDKNVLGRCVATALFRPERVLRTRIPRFLVPFFRVILELWKRQSAFDVLEKGPA